MKFKSEPIINKMRESYRSLRVGRSMHCSSIGNGDQRVIGVGNKYIRLMNGKSIVSRDVLDWWIS
jgi:hypothetical protein